jgi:uncharacterized protein
MARLRQRAPVARGALRWLALVVLAAAAGHAVAQSLQPIPRYEARVTDLTGTLTAGQQSALEEKLRAFEARKGSQLAVLIVPTTKPEEIEQYSIRVFDEWKPGRKNVNDGALLLVAKNDREMRIEVGRGLEGSLTDVISHRIISETITPLFRQGDFYGGINAGLDQMIRVVDGEQLPAPDEQWHGGTQKTLGFLPILFVGVLIGSALLRGIFGRTVGSAVTGAAAGGVLWLVGHALLLAAFGGVVAFVLSLLFGLGAGRTWSNYPRSGGWGGGFGGLGGGGGFGGGGFGGGGFGGGGGFSGGGGGTGAGGGASGSW